MSIEYTDSSGKKYTGEVEVVAGELGISVEALKKRLFRAKKSLKTENVMKKSGKPGRKKGSKNRVLIAKKYAKPVKMSQIVETPTLTPEIEKIIPSAILSNPREIFDRPDKKEASFEDKKDEKSSNDIVMEVKKEGEIVDFVDRIVHPDGRIEIKRGPCIKCGQLTYHTAGGNFVCYDTCTPIYRRAKPLEKPRPSTKQQLEYYRRVIKSFEKHPKE